MPYPKISVVIPTYNVEPYIKETLKSLLNQKKSPFEIVIINDGSTDGTLELLNNHFGHRSELKIHTQANQGVGAARTKGLELATGDYIFFCDPDDVVADNLFETFCSQIAANPDLELFYFSKRSFIESPHGREFLRRNTAATRNGAFDHGRELLQDLILSQKYNASTWQYIFKKTVADRFEARFEGRAHEDHLFSMNIYLHSKKTYATPQDCYFQRVRIGSLTQSKKDESYVLESYDAYQQTLGALKLHIHQFSDSKSVALNFMERNVSALITKCIKYNIKLPNRINTSSRKDARDCNIIWHGRSALIFPSIVFWLKMSKYNLRMVLKSLRS